MKKSERAEIILKELKNLYPSPPIPLDHTNAFTLLVAVVLSAQSTDKKVNELTKELFKVIFPLEGNSKPAINLKRVVLPQPEGPRSPNNSPFLIFKLIALSIQFEIF